MWIRWIAVIAVLVIVAAITAVRFELLHVPARLNPWAPLVIDERPNLLTRFKLDRASGEDLLCRQALQQTGWQYTAIDDEVTQPGCGYKNAVRIERMDMDVGTAFAASCREALSLAMWEKHVVQPAALHYFGRPVTKLEHFGSYSCRSVYGRPNARMSNHATADALDVAGFVIGGDTSGEVTRVRVLGDWNGEGPEAQFLREIHDGACRFFDSVLGPEYNAAHRDHFHLDRGSFRTPGIRCRTAQSVVDPGGAK